MMNYLKNVFTVVGAADHQRSRLRFILAVSGSFHALIQITISLKQPRLLRQVE
jgi:hypothetical protein